jgi:uncharacterized protein (TIGR02145 family)
MSLFSRLFGSKETKTQSDRNVNNTNDQVNPPTVEVDTYIKGDQVNPPTVRIGTQTWATKNLDVSEFRNGDPIPEVRTDADWEKAGDQDKPAWCYYENDPANGTKYGKLYNWYAVNDPRGLAPAGWHVPTDVEWDNLELICGGREVAGYYLKETGTTHWKVPNTGATNGSGFTGLPGGYRNGSGPFYDVVGFGFWWSSTEYNNSEPWVRYLCYNNGTVIRFFSYKRIGYSVRCLRD